MAVYLQVEELTKSVGDRMLFENVTFGINEGDKIGIVAKNGTGKTTLLNIIAGVDTPDSGTVTYRGDLKVCYLTQLPELTPGASIIEACLEGGGAVAETVARYERAVAEGDADQISVAVHDMDAAGAWDYEDREKQMLSQ